MFQKCTFKLIEKGNVAVFHYTPYISWQCHHRFIPLSINQVLLSVNKQEGMVTFMHRFIEKQRKVRSFREANFELYVQCFGQFVAWMCAFFHTNNPRLLPIHIKDMTQLKETVTSVYEKFNKGNLCYTEVNKCLFNHGNGSDP